MTACPHCGREVDWHDDITSGPYDGCPYCQTGIRLLHDIATRQKHELEVQS